MALTGLQIFKLLPKTNCKECGFPTCLAFAMKLAQKGTELSKCPTVSDEAKAALDAAAAPPIRLITVGTGDRAFSVGNEVCMYRHEKTFFNQPGLMVRVKDNDPALADLAKQIDSYKVSRVGIEISLDGIAIDNVSGNAATFGKAAETVKANSSVPLVLVSEDPAAIAAALALVGDQHPLIAGATADNWQKMAELAVGASCALVAKADTIDGLATLAADIQGVGVEDIVLDPGAREAGAALTLFTQLRRLAIKKNFRQLGFPIIAFAQAGSAEEDAVLANVAISKYAGVIVLDTTDPAVIYPLITLRQNIYTDPQKPIQMEPKLYQVGSVDADSAVFVTTNFSLTYFTVSGEIEAGGKPVWLLVADGDGLSVLTSWAAGKFDAEKIAKTVKLSGIADKISHRKLVIPGYVASLSGELEDELPDWEIIVGPRESVDIPGFLKNVWKAS